MKNNMRKILISIVDDHELFCEGLEIVLTQIEDFNILSKASNGKEFIKQLDYLQPDVVLMDISMPEMDGVQATKLALSKFPDLKIITLSSYGDEVYYYKMIKAGAYGFIQKKSGKKELEKAIRTVLEGNSYFPKELMKKIIFKKGNAIIDTVSNCNFEISKREKQVLELICQGYSNNDIAEKLFISPNTVENHRSKLVLKTGARNSSHMVLIAIKEKLIKI